MNIGRFKYKPLMPMLIFFLFSLMASSGWAATYYVDVSKGNDANSGTSENAPWKTIAKVNNASFNPGDRILFKSGEIWTGKTLEVPSDGLEGNNITIGSYGTGNKPVIDGSGLSKTVHLDGRSYITINNLEIKGGGHGILINSSSTNGMINVTNCTIHDSESNNGLSINSRGNVTIENSTIYNCTNSGISAYTLGASSWDERKGNNIKLIGNSIYNNSGTGFYVFGDNVVVQSNEFYGNGGGDNTGLKHNIYIIGDNARVERNILRDAVYGCGIRFEGSDLSIQYNLIEHNRKHGIGIWNDIPKAFSNLNISYNVFLQRHYSETPVSLPLAIDIDKASGAGDFSDIKIHNNSVYGENDNANGFKFDNCSNVDVRNNIIQLKDAYLVGASSASITSDYNMFSSEKSNAFYAGTYKTFSQWQGQGYDKHSKYGDPKFTDPGNKNLTLQSDSPAINAGETLGQAQDIGLDPDTAFPSAVKTLDQDSFNGWEMGAYVYRSSEPPAAPKNIRME